MKDSLAKKLLIKVTDWDPEELTEERLDLQLLSEYKYDEYQQFSPGMRFIESLSLWLNQFKEEGTKELAYKLIKNNLIFISTSELHHLIKMAYPDCIKQYLIEQISRDIDIPEIFIKKIICCEKFEILKRESLFLGLSDGARTDLFRRFSDLKHEQVYSTYLITKEKSNELLEELNEDISGSKSGKEKYKIVFLMDDFSASGISYLREEEGKFKGKIEKFYRQLEQKDDQPKFQRDLFDMDKLKICVVLFIATTKAIQRIKEATKKLINSQKIIIDILVIQEIDDSIALDETKLGALASTLKEKFDESILTEQYKKGKHDKPFLGFDECGLPIVLSHNCPNNSLPIIWHESEDKKYRALFPRLQRYKVLP